MSLLDTLTKSLIDIYAKQLNTQEQEELLHAIEIIANEEKYNKFKNIFPDEGPYRRGLYRKHINFFNAGAKFRERAFVAGNRIGKCISYDTLVDLPDGTKEKAGILYERGPGFTLNSWTGTGIKECLVTECVKKAPEPLVRIWLSNGAHFDCAMNHRILVNNTYVFVADLIKDVLCLPVSTEELGLKVQFQDVARWFETLLNYLGDYSGGFHPYGEQLLSVRGNDPISVPPQGGAPQPAAFWLHGDGQGCRRTSNGQLVCDLLSNLCGVLHGEALSSCVSDQLVLTDAQVGILNIESTPQSVLAYVQHSVAQLISQYQCQFVSLHSPIEDGIRVIAYNLIPLSDVYDFSLPEHSNYISHGIVHHNTEAGAFETVCHATGLYPDWWEGRRYTRPILGWIGGDTASTCRDIIQQKLLGNIGDFGSGMIPKDLIIDTKTRRNVADAIETIRVKHISGGTSTLVIKTYDQGREAWQGAEVDWLWVDEECDQSVYGEGLIRLMTTNGSAILTFTPLSGLTDLVKNFLDNSQDTDSKYRKYVAVVSWDDVPHISQEMKDEMLAATPPALRAARSKGEPTVGSGRIYPVDINKVQVEDFKVPKHWMKAYGMDVGWNNTAVCFGAWDRDNDVVYIYSEHKQGEAEPIIHAKAVKARGEWLRGVIDPAARGRSQIDGSNLFSMYKKEGLKIYPADNAVEAGIYEVWQRLSTGRLKIFKSCTSILRELALYHRDDKGKIVKKDDHLLDCLRYLCMSMNTTVWQYPQDPRTKEKVVDLNQYMRACT